MHKASRRVAWENKRAEIDSGTKEYFCLHGISRYVSFRAAVSTNLVYRLAPVSPTDITGGHQLNIRKVTLM